MLYETSCRTIDLQGYIIALCGPWRRQRLRYTLTRDLTPAPEARRCETIRQTLYSEHLEHVLPLQGLRSDASIW